MARSREFDESVALAAVEAVFWRQGYAASYADLMAATGLGKGSMYAAFGDKRSLFCRVLTRYVDREVGLLEAVLNNDEESAGAAKSVERIRMVMQYPITMAAGQGGTRLGCFMCFSAMEVAPGDSEVAEIVGGAMARIDAALRTGLLAAGAPPSLAPAFGAVYFGVQVMARAGAPIETLEAVAEGALSMLGTKAIYGKM
jgi:TetR/AcrR family transcriptional repressor of nem operon